MNYLIGETFSNAKPHAVDFPQADYESRKAVYDTIANAHGYRLAGFRLKRAVFTTKQPITPDA